MRDPPSRWGRASGVVKGLGMEEDWGTRGEAKSSENKSGARRLGGGWAEGRLTERWGIGKLG